MGQAMAGAAKAAVKGVSAPSATGGTMLGHAIAAEGLIDAVRDVARAIREDTASEKARETDRIAKALDELLEHDRREREKPVGRR